MQQNLKQLIDEYSIQITEETEFDWNGEVKKLPLENTIETFKKDKPYATASKVIAFIHDGKMYITPRTSAAIGALRRASYHEMAFLVPLGPKGMVFKDPSLADYWQELVGRTNPVEHSAQSLKKRRAELAKSRPSMATDDWTELRRPQSAVAPA